MSRPIRAVIKNVRGWVYKTESRKKKILAGQGTPGTRAAPTQSGNNDPKIGGRLDNGEEITKDGKAYKRYKFQLNKNAEDPTIKALAAKDSHRVFAQADLPLEAKDKEAALEDFFGELEESVDKFAG